MGVVIWPHRSLSPPALHAAAVLVTPSVVIAVSTIAAATVLTTAAPHGLVSGDTVAIAGHAGSTPALDGSRVVTVIDALHFSIPIAVSVAGAGGRVTRERARGVLTLAEGKLRAGLDWVTGDPRDDLMLQFIAAAESKVQQDTGLVGLLKTYDVFYDALSGGPIGLPWRPVFTLESVACIDTAGVRQVLAADQYELDPGSETPLPARLALSSTGAWPTDLRSFQPFVVRLVAGFPAVALLPPWFVHAVGLLTAHYATVGRDLTTVGTIITTTPHGYDAIIAPYQLVTVA
jgi:uncharacterized phiE125 gp8 family phage protein